MACALIVAIFYSHTGAFGVRSILAVDIASFVVAIAVAQWTSLRLILAGGWVPPRWLSVAAVVLLIAGVRGGHVRPAAHPPLRGGFDGEYGPGEGAPE